MSSSQDKFNMLRIGEATKTSIRSIPVLCLLPETAIDKLAESIATEAIASVRSPEDVDLPTIYLAAQRGIAATPLACSLGKSHQETLASAIAAEIERTHKREGAASWSVPKQEVLDPAESMLMLAILGQLQREDVGSDWSSTREQAAHNIARRALAEGYSRVAPLEERVRDAMGRHQLTLNKDADARARMAARACEALLAAGDWGGETAAQGSQANDSEAQIKLDRIADALTVLRNNADWRDDDEESFSERVMQSDRTFEEAPTFLRSVFAALKGLPEGEAELETRARARELEAEWEKEEKWSL